MKKILSLLLVIAMMFSSMSMVFATTFEDIDSKNELLSEVSSLLHGLEIIKGYEDGTFKPEKVVTRAEMAAMLIRAKGYETIANDTPSFSDSQNHWAKGYIALASDLRIINGRGNGIFDPDATVTYEEAATMVLRALGYTDESINGGKSTVYNPANYRTKALSLGMFNDFTFSSVNAGANRGNVALMVNRALSSSTVYTNEDGRAVIEKDENGNAIKLLNAIAKKQTLTVDKKLAAQENLVDMTAYLYQSVDAYIKDGKVIFVDRVNSKVVSGEISAANDEKITLKSGDKGDYALNSTSAAVFYNADEASYSAAKNVLVGSNAKLVLDKDSKVVGVIAVKETDAKLIKNVYKTNSTVINGIVLPTKSNKVDLTKVTVTGDVDAIEDIKVNDVVKAFAALNNTAVKLEVTRNSIEGKIVRSNNDGSRVFIDTAGEYKTVLNGTLALNDAGTFFLDKDGNIFGFSKTSSEAPASDFAIITGNSNGVALGDLIIKYPSINVKNAKGENLTLTIAEDAKYDVLAADGKQTTTNGNAYTENDNTLVLADALKAGAIVKSVVVEDDQVTKVVIQTLENAKKNIDVTSKTFDTASNVVIFNQYTVDGKEVYTVSTLEKLVALKSVEANKFSYIANANGELTVILVKGSAIVTPDLTIGVIAEQQKVVNENGKVVHQLVAYINGEKVTYLSNEALGQTNVNAGPQLVKFTLANGVVTGITTVDASLELEIGNVESKINNTSDDSFMVEKTKYFMNDDAAIYVCDEDGDFLRVGSMSELEGLNLTIRLYLNTDNSRLVDNIVVIMK